MSHGAPLIPESTLATPGNDTRRGAYRWVLVALLWWVCFFNYADRQAIFSVFPLLARDLHLGTVQLGFAGSAFMWTYALAGPFAGWLVDRLNRKWIIVVALLFWSAVTAGMGLVHSYTPLIVLRALSGLGEAFYFPAALSLIGSYHTPGSRSKAMATHQSGVYVGTVAGGGLAAWIAERSGWHGSFLVPGVGGILLACVLAVALREPAVHPPMKRAAPTEGHAGGFGSILRNRWAMTLVIVFVGANFVASALLTWLPTYLYQRMHLGLASAGWQSTLFLQGASVIGVLLGGAMADRSVRRGAGGRVRTQAFGLLAGAPFLLLLGVAPTMPLLIPVLLGAGLCKGMYDANIWASLYDTVGPKERGFAAGLMNSIGWIGGGLAPLYVALWSRRAGMASAFGSTALLYLLLGIGMLVLSRRMSQKPAR